MDCKNSTLHEKYNENVPCSLEQQILDISSYQSNKNLIRLMHLCTTTLSVCVFPDSCEFYIWISVFKKCFILWPHSTVCIQC